MNNYYIFGLTALGFFFPKDTGLEKLDHTTQTLLSTTVAEYTYLTLVGSAMTGAVQ